MFSTDDAYDPPTSSNDATAAFTIPFAFPIDIVALEQNITTGYQGTSFAELVIPKGPSSTDVDTRIIHLTFNNTPFAVFADQHAVFQQFLADTTMNANETFTLSGAANTDAQTAVGLLSLMDIEFALIRESGLDLEALDTFVKPRHVARTCTISHDLDRTILPVNEGVKDSRDVC
jgi:hypothetical protein